MDATPVTLGQEFGGYAAQVEDGIARLRDALPRLCALPLGGTAVGTGINAPKGFAAQGDRAARRRAPACRSPRRKDHFAAQGARDALVETSGQLRALAVSLDQDRERPALDGRAARAPGWPRSACPTCSPARRSCPAR